MLDIPRTGFWIKMTGVVILLIGIIISTNIVGRLSESSDPKSNKGFVAAGLEKIPGLVMPSYYKSSAERMYYNKDPAATETSASGLNRALREPVENLLHFDFSKVPDEKKLDMISSGISSIKDAVYESGVRPYVSEALFQRSQARLLLVLSSTAVGVNTLVLTTSFGTWKDLVACLLWGLGSPIGSKAITSLISLVTK